jgi:hypothetical protein
LVALGLKVEAPGDVICLC